MKKLIAGYFRILDESFNLLNVLIILTVIFVSLLLTFPILDNIPPHPDEYQFYTNAFSIMGGKELANYLHVAFTEYLLTGFLTLMNLFTRSGINFPQADVSLTTIYYGRVFGLLLYLLTYTVGFLIVQKGERRVRLMAIFFTLFYFGSLGFFERFLRVNSDSMMVFLFANYFFVSLFLYKQRAPLYYVFLNNLLFLFLFSFTNLKSLFLALPVFLIGTGGPLIWDNRDPNGGGSSSTHSRFLPHLVFFLNLIGISVLILTRFNYLYLILPLIVLNSLNPVLWSGVQKSKLGHAFINIYKIILYVIGLIAGVLYLWTIFIPKPFNAHNFWYQIKNTIVFGTEFDFDYPMQSYRSWLVYIYDLFVEYVGPIPLAVSGVLLAASFKILGRKSLKIAIRWLKSRPYVGYFKSGDLHPISELILCLSFLTYYFGVSARVVHWSRWGVPLGFIFIILLSSFLEKVVRVMILHFRMSRAYLYGGLFLLGTVVFIPRFFLTFDLGENAFPATAGHNQTYRDVDKFIREVKLSQSEASTSAVWFTGPTNNIGNISLEKLSEPLYKRVRYIFWPQWNIGPLYTLKNVDKSTHNQRAFVDKYAQSVIYRFPTTLSRYTHYAKYLAWRYLGITYAPELESLVEPQYAVVNLKDINHPINYEYVLNFDDLSHYFVPRSEIFNLNNLYESYMFPPCYSNPAVAYISSGVEVALDPQTGSRTLGFHCHGLRFRVAFKGIYKIKIEGLPNDFDDSRMVYSAYSYHYDPKNRIITFVAPQTFISVEFGVAAKESLLPDLRFHIYYQELTPEMEEALNKQKNL